MGSWAWAASGATLTDARVLAALKLSFGLSALAALLNAPLGLLIAWVLVRYDFPGRRVLDALVDLPFALPTAVAGIALTALYAPTGPLGALAAKVGIKTAYTPLGIFIALLFIGLPFVVRAGAAGAGRLRPRGRGGGPDPGRDAAPALLRG